MSKWARFLYDDGDVQCPKCKAPYEAICKPMILHCGLGHHLCRDCVRRSGKCVMCRENIPDPDCLYHDVLRLRLSQATQSGHNEDVSGNTSSFDSWQLIGGGGFGQVFKARHKFDSREYAIKRVKLRGEREVDEVKQLARLEHPNIVHYNNAWKEKSLEGLLPDGMPISTPASTKTSSPPRPPLIMEPSLANIEKEAAKISLQDESLQIPSDMIGAMDSSSTPELGLDGRDEAENRPGPGPDPLRIGDENVSNTPTTTDEDLNPSLAKETKPREVLFLYIHMEFCNTTLRDCMDQVRADQSRRWKIFDEITQGLDFIHRNDVIHRDLKPANILLDANGTAKIGDFGLSRQSTVDSDGEKLEPDLDDYLTGGVGTRGYRAPEVAATQRAKYTQKADMFSLGVILGEMTAQTRAEVTDTVTKIQASLDVPLTHENYPEFVLAARLCAKCPEDRPDCTEALRAIEHNRWIVNRNLNSNETNMRFKYSVPVKGDIDNAQECPRTGKIYILQHNYSELDSEPVFFLSVYSKYWTRIRYIIPVQKWDPYNSPFFLIYAEDDKIYFFLATRQGIQIRPQLGVLDLIPEQGPAAVESPIQWQPLRSLSSSFSMRAQMRCINREQQPRLFVCNMRSGVFQVYRGDGTKVKTFKLERPPRVPRAVSRFAVGSDGCIYAVRDGSVHKFGADGSHIRDIALPVYSIHPILDIGICLDGEGRLFIYDSEFEPEIRILDDAGALLGSFPVNYVGSRFAIPRSIFVTRNGDIVLRRYDSTLSVMYSPI